MTKVSNRGEETGHRTLVRTPYFAVGVTTVVVVVLFVPNRDDSTDDSNAAGSDGTDDAGASGDAAERSTRRSRPETEESYGIPESAEGMLSWEFVAEKMAGDRNYWVTTTRPDGRPHARPVWGVWLDDTFHCGGGPKTRWVRNLAANPGIAVHRESGEEVVIIEGEAERLTGETADAARLERIDDAYEEKYDVRHGTPVFAVRPDTVLAWSDYPDDATRWEFDASEEPET